MKKPLNKIFCALAALCIAALAAVNIWALDAKTAAVSMQDVAETAAPGENLTSASSMAVLEVSTNRVLYQKNMIQKRPMASTTKIMTAIVVLENSKLDDIVTVDKRAVGVEGSSIYLGIGEKQTVENLLFGLMLQSGNDAAAALAYHVSGSIEAFAALMNETAQKIGAVNSHFVNPHGLHDDNHFTTAYDLALLSAYGMRNPDFKRIVGTKDKSIPWEGRDYDRKLHNKNKILANYDGGNGVKTGFTKKAGRCLVASSERDGLEVVSVVLNCGPMFEDCEALMTKAHGEYKMTEILPAYMHLGDIPVVGGKESFCKVYSKNPCFYPLKDYEKNGVHGKIELPEQISAPVKKDSEIGKIKIYYNNQLLFVEKIYTMEDVKTIGFKEIFLDIVNKWLRKTA